jgi:NAD(P)H-dependent FMN reductase
MLPSLFSVHLSHAFFGELDKIAAAKSPTPRIAIVSSSTEKDSKSRALALAYKKEVELAGGLVDFIDLKDVKVPLYGQGSPKKIDPHVARFNKADAWVIASPIHNWGPAAHTTNFLTHALDSGGGTFKPFVLLAGAGSPRAHLALSGLAQAISTEVNGVHVGAPIVSSEAGGGGTGDRIKHSAQALVQVTHATLHLSQRGVRIS